MGGAIKSGKLTGKSLAIVYINRGAEWKAKKDNEKALADYTIAINLDSSIPAIYNNRANIYSERGELDHDPDDPGIYQKLADFLSQNQLGAHEEEVYRRAIQQFDEPQVVYDHPANMFVAGFMGSPSMNFIAGEIVKLDGRPAVAVALAGGETATLPLALIPAINGLG